MGSRRVLRVTASWYVLLGVVNLLVLLPRCPRRDVVTELLQDYAFVIQNALTYDFGFPLRCIRIRELRWSVLRLGETRSASSSEIAILVERHNQLAVQMLSLCGLDRGSFEQQALEAELWHSSVDPGQRHRCFVSGRRLIVNCGFWASATAALHLVRFRRQSSLYQQRLRNALCVGCGYDLRGDVCGRCPECGTPIPKSSASATCGGAP